MSQKSLEKHCVDEVNEVNETDELKSEGPWPDKNETLFVDLIDEEVAKGNRPTTTFTRTSWNYMRNQLNTSTGYAYTHDQLKNKFNKLRQIYKDFKKILSDMSGNCWDPLLGTITLEEEQWNDLFKVNRRAKRFKKSGCPHYAKLMRIFGDTTATGASACPSTKLPSDSEDENDVGSNTNFTGEDNDPEKSRKRVRRKKDEFSSFISSFIDVYAENAKRRNDILEKKSLNSAASQIGEGQTSKAKDDVDVELMECFKILNAMEDLDGEAYTKVLKLLHGDVSWRKLFLLMPDARRKDFIRSI